VKQAKSLGEFFKKAKGIKSLALSLLLEVMNMSFSIGGLSASAVSVLVAFFMIASKQIAWGVGFVVLAIVLAIISANKS
jgi:hypothetical protein